MPCNLIRTRWFQDVMRAGVHFEGQRKQKGCSSQFSFDISLNLPKICHWNINTSPDVCGVFEIVISKNSAEGILNIFPTYSSRCK